MTEEIRNKLLLLQDEKYKEFNSKLCPGTSNILGVRIPLIKKLAKEYKDEYIKDITSYILLDDEVYNEEVMLKGLLIGYLKKDINEIFSLLENFIPKINNWAICDTTVANLKIINNNKEKTLKFIEKYLKSNNEFEVRFALIVLLDYFIEKEYLNYIFTSVEKIKLDKYYVKMAIAWLLSICYIKYKEETLTFLNNTNLDKWTFNKTIQKIIESRRINDKEKEKLKKLKKK